MVVVGSSFSVCTLTEDEEEHKEIIMANYYAWMNAVWYLMLHSQQELIQLIHAKTKNGKESECVALKFCL